MSNRDLKASDVCFVATAGSLTSYLGSITNAKAARTEGFVHQRLLLTAHESLGASEYGDCVAYLPHIIQARIPDSIDPPACGKTYNASDVPGTMLFGARKRPLQLDLTLLESWIDICCNEHGKLCADTLGGDVEV